MSIERKATKFRTLFSVDCKTTARNADNFSHKLGVKTYNVQTS